MTSSVTTTSISVRLTDAEKAQLEREAEAEGITTALLVYRRALNKPDAERKRGRKPKHDPNQPEGLFDVAV